MKSTLLSLSFIILAAATLQAAEKKEIPNRLIDYPGFLKDADTVGKLRQQRRVTEDEFLVMAADPATIIFDARSAEKYRLLHVKGATNLSLPDITEAELAKVIPTKDTRVLIYCNNNFENEEAAFPGKAVRLSLNIFTFNTLYGYGYTNIYELGPLLDIHKSKLPFAGTAKAKP